MPRPSTKIKNLLLLSAIATGNSCVIGVPALHHPDGASEYGRGMIKKLITNPACQILMLATLAATLQSRNADFSQVAKRHPISPLVLSTSPRRSTTSSEVSGTDRTSPFFSFYYNDVYEVKLPKNHRFPMEKYRKVRELVQHRIASRRKSNEDHVNCQFQVSPLASVEELTLAHCPQYVQRFMIGDLTKEEIRNVGFPWSKAGVDRACSSVGGTIAASLDVCNEWISRGGDNQTIPPWSAHIAGGTHHAFFDRGEGFCVFSDIAVAAEVVLKRFPNTIRRILIIDLDVHQGNGNAVLFQDRPEVFTFSIQCIANYFSKKQNSDLDIELPIECDDETYLVTLQHWLKQIHAHAGEFDLIFFQAGVDILEHDRLGRMNVSAQGLKRRNQLVFDFATKTLRIPLVITMGGGYPHKDNWPIILDAHANVYFQVYEYLAGIETTE